jgi:hypothetical protein
MKICIISIFIYIFSFSILANPILDEVNQHFYNQMEKDFRNQIGREVFSAYGSKLIVKEIFGKRCGCSLKGSDPDNPESNELEKYSKFSDNGVNSALTGDSSLLKESPNFYNNILLGDSLTQLGTTDKKTFTWNKDYAPGWGIINGGVGMATSQDMSEWLDSCASQTDSNLWTDSPEQLPCGGNSRGRFACNPPPNQERYKGYVQFQNRNVYLMIGGNDFNVGLYKTLLETFPVLIPFRHNHVANQLDRILTYIERQSGTRKNLIGYMPLPSYYPGSGESLLATLGRLNLFNRYDHWFEKTADGRTVVKANYQDIPGGRTIAATASLLNDYLEKSLRGQPVSISTLWECFSTFNLSGDGFCDKMRGDNSWVSQRLIELNLVMASVAQSREAGMHTLYFTFVDYDALSKGYWYVGNKNFWNMDFNANDFDELLYQFLQSRSSNDSIHPNHLGYQAYGSTLDTIFKHENANIKQTPFGYKDGCFIEPNDPGPYEECLTKIYHEWENNKCVDKTPKPPAPTIVTNPTPPNSERPQEPPPPSVTYEPPPRPAVDDNALLLLGLCFFFGACRL